MRHDIRWEFFHVLREKYYEVWDIKMHISLCSESVWYLVVYGYVEPTDEETE